MQLPAVDSPPVRLNDFVARYERVQERDGRAEVVRFLPEPAHPLYPRVLRELVRLDLEYGWQRGQPLSLEEYQRRFPELLAPDAVQDLVFEEYRLRCQAGEQPSLLSYERRYGVSTRDWPVPTEISDCGLPLADRSSQSAIRNPQSEIAWPAVGDRFLGFQLVAELGRGVFGRVYLARQDDLAGRPVALKVSAAGRGESQTLAQLQHSHIVPVYSFHSRPPFQAVCMPYFGPTTLADVLRDVRGRASLPSSGADLVSTLLSVVRCPLSVDRCNLSTDNGQRTTDDGQRTTDNRSQTEFGNEPSLPRVMLAGLSYVEAVLWIGARLAGGLGHAHERGILHLDLKPANVLLTDDGQPMLLDFNLAEDVKQRPLSAAVAVGGTLPYMAPEHLEAFAGRPASLDGRSDVYALGVLLYELLTGKAPFPSPASATWEAVPRLLVERGRRPPPLRHWNPAVTPAVESIVGHCLEPRQENRYRSARDLQEDLERQLQHRPLRHAADRSPRERARKWLRRHPCLASSATLLAASAALLFLLLSALLRKGQRLEAFEAAETFRQFQTEARAVHFLNSRAAPRAELDEAAGRCRRLLGRYAILDAPAWQERAAVRALGARDRRRRAEEVGDLLRLWARMTVLRQDGGRAAALAAALDLNRKAEACSPRAAVLRVVWRQRADLLRQLGRADEARRLPPRPPRDLAEEAAPASARDLALDAAEHAASDRYADALGRLEEATRSDPRSFWAWLDRGLCHEPLGQPGDAAACYGTCIALAPEFAPLYFKRGLAYLRLGKHREAAADFDQAASGRRWLIPPSLR